MGVIAFFMVEPSAWHLVVSALTRSVGVDWSEPAIRKMLLLGGIGAFLFGLLNSWYGRRVLFAMWGALFDYGRNWNRIAIIALFGIGVFGILYMTLPSTDVCILKPGSQSECITQAGDAHWAYPFFVAALGLLTLGLQSNLVPHSGLGQIVVLANVLSGWLTFGLLLSVLQNQFAKRF